jgi:hypothetical protein
MNLILARRPRTGGLGCTETGAFDMLSSIIGAALIVSGGGFFWYLLPRNGQVNPLVRNSDVGSMVMIAILSILTIGTTMLYEGLFG